MCVFDAWFYLPSGFLYDSDETLTNDKKDPISVLGFRFRPCLSRVYHMLDIRKKMRRRFWTIINLRKRGFSEQELVEVYETFTRPVAENCDVVFHSMLSDEQTELIENLQNHVIYSLPISATKMWVMSGL